MIWQLCNLHWRWCPGGMDRPRCCQEPTGNFDLLLPSAEDHLGWDLDLAMLCSRTGPPCLSSSPDQSHFLRTGNWATRRRQRMESSFSSRWVAGCEHTNEGLVGSWRNKGWVWRSCPHSCFDWTVSGGLAGSRRCIPCLLRALCIAQFLEKVYPTPRTGSLVRPFILHRRENRMKKTGFVEIVRTQICLGTVPANRSPNCQPIVN